MKITYFVAASLDGFIATKDGDVSWLEGHDTGASEAELEVFMAEADGLVMGRGTYDFVFDYGSWPYGDKPTWVFTHRELPRLENANLIVTSDVDLVIQDAKLKELHHLWLVGGGQLASTFLERNLISHIRITQLPVKLTDGIPIFSRHQMEDIPCESRRVTEHGGVKQVDICIRSTVA